MKYVGIDLHKKTIVLCVVNQERTVLARQRFLCVEVKRIVAWFRELGEFEFVVEAMGTYDWLVELLEPLAKAWVLANPGKMRLIAETAKKTDRVDAQWTAVMHSARWRGVYEGLKKRRGAKRAIVAVARRLLAVVVSMLKSGEEYRYSLAELNERDARSEQRKKQRRKARAARAAAVMV